MRCVAFSRIWCIVHFRCPEHALRDERGGVAAEFAVTLPAVVLVVLLVAGVMSAAAQRVVLQDAVADASRLIAREDDPVAATGHVARVVPGARVSVAADGDVVCVTGAVTVRLAGAIGVDIDARSCALGDGR